LYEIKYTMLYGPSAKVSLLYQMAEQETTCGGAKVGRLTYDHAIVSSSKVKYTDIAKFAGHLPHCYGNSRAIWDHTVLPATRQR